MIARELDDFREYWQVVRLLVKDGNVPALVDVGDLTFDVKLTNRVLALSSFRQVIQHVTQTGLFDGDNLRAFLVQCDGKLVFAFHCIKDDHFCATEPPAHLKVLAQELVPHLTVNIVCQEPVRQTFQRFVSSGFGRVEDAHDVEFPFEMAHQSLLSIAHIGLQGPYLFLDIGDLVRKLDQLCVMLLTRESVSQEGF